MVGIAHPTIEFHESEENNDFDDASLLASRADRLYEELENLEIVILDLE